MWRCPYGLWMHDLLADVTVYESSAFVAAPLAGLTLRQSGATVVRVDPPGGGLDYRRMPRDRRTGESLFWTNLNRGKQSVCIDLRQDEGADLLAALITMAPQPGNGIFLTNLPRRPALSHAALSRQRADVISVEVTGNFDGTSAVDYTVNPATGLPLLTGHSSRDNPTNHVLPAWDIACGLHAAQLIVSLLYRRSRTGKGADAKIALSDVAFSTIGHLGLLSEAVHNGDREPTGNYLFGGFGRDFVTADERRIMVVGLTARQWTALVEGLSMAAEIATLERQIGTGLGDEQVRFEHRRRIAEIVERRIGALTLAEIEAAFGPGVSWQVYRTAGDLVHSDPRLGAANAMWSRRHERGADVPVPGSPYNISGLSRAEPPAPPVLGADTESVLIETLGLSAAQFGALVDRGVVGVPA